MSITLTRPAGTLPGGAVRISSTELPDSLVLVTVVGELDAHNARELVAFVDALTVPHAGLIVNLTSLVFFGTEGLWALNRINAVCAKRHAASVIVSGREAARLLSICDPHGALRVVDTMDDALPAIRQRVRMLATPPL
jgi:anti-anti-sigma factor